uniref:Uncharacterized protein n=1 Tax=Trieres chinensis TaxID=1514140 RepID=A0A7S2ELZ5_TRICV|mmetsp:Transcript_30025/g.61268  ORF Transcript_30025/g.61268 Transcript_30025/m.61268 type:complete len:161 (+) Transcript_30025:200-682(+)|eukprot:CAMPEP_0183308176 /NCGR_PEP_ID=MMETSP0160_2-20130417/20287_1 /TAXON_ID=2839 ORGANISM="Odontella Sinensis, Strain Grunow 1884" /NCGR_SAMPLE_ID=MMETSP0160_2 /ASSEMBLY_ACC=CAM_ASM_000250 /LENGTH=160 /DNA_ID=CAMNT_0025471955 /DNA_START=198 /DNA_END=680 /DNA_ORIENTATION=+
MPKSPEDINAMMARVCPELASSYAKYPLKGNMWLSTSATVNGSATFIAETNKQPPLKLDYVHGPGPLGFGYYHLTTRAAYRALYPRLQSQAPLPCCACTKDARNNLSDHEDVTMIVYNRSVATIPDDDKGKEDALAIARGEAQAAYHFTQNEQLFFMAVT